MSTQQNSELGKLEETLQNYRKCKAEKSPDCLKVSHISNFKNHSCINCFRYKQKQYYMENKDTLKTRCLNIYYRNKEKGIVNYVKKMADKNRQKQEIVKMIDEIFDKPIEADDKTKEFSSPFSSLNHIDLKSLRVYELKELCKKHKIRITGLRRKEQFIEEIKEHLLNSDSEPLKKSQDIQAS